MTDPAVLPIDPTKFYVLTYPGRLTEQERLSIRINWERNTAARCMVLAEGIDPEGVYAEIKAERERAHAKHGDRSMERRPEYDVSRLAILLEEVGEVARVFNDAPPNAVFPWADLRSELIQVAAMAAAWADIIGPDR